MKQIKAIMDLDNMFPYVVYDLPSIKPQKLIGLPVHMDGKIVGEIIKAEVKKTEHGNKLEITANAFSRVEGVSLGNKRNTPKERKTSS